MRVKTLSIPFVFWLARPCAFGVAWRNEQTAETKNLCGYLIENRSREVPRHSGSGKSFRTRPLDTFWKILHRPVPDFYRRKGVSQIACYWLLEDETWQLRCVYPLSGFNHWVDYSGEGKHAWVDGAVVDSNAQYSNCSYGSSSVLTTLRQLNPLGHGGSTVRAVRALDNVCQVFPYRINAEPLVGEGHVGLWLPRPVDLHWV